jgi:hypothetical protein
MMLDVFYRWPRGSLIALPLISLSIGQESIAFHGVSSKIFLSCELFFMTAEKEFQKLINKLPECKFLK